MRSMTRTKLLALVLALALTVSLILTATANNIPGDINGDQKVTVFDAQMLLEEQQNLRTLTAAQKAAAADTSLESILQFVLGKIPGAFDFNGDGILEIYTAEGLEYMAKSPNSSYILMNNINLNGESWTPISAFNGTFDGNGYTISNLTIAAHTDDSHSSSVKNMGFFGDTESNAVIKDLNLRNVTVAATESAEYIGLLIGSNRGKIENCTVTGTVIDSRQSHETAAYIGAMAGRICSGADNASLVGGTSLSITDTAGAKTTSGLCANVQLLIENDENVNIGLCGYYPSNASVSGIWADTSNSSALLSDTLLARRDEVVRYMNEMGSVAWTPAETLKYTDARGSTATYSKGTTYYGLPYNHKNGSMERFLSVMASYKNGVYTTKTGLGNSVIDADGKVEGFVQLMGNDCADAIAQAWQRVSPVIVADVANHHPPYHGGAFITSTVYMVPKTSVRNTYGIYQVGDWSSFSKLDPVSKLRVATELDLTEAAYQCPDDDKTTKAVLLLNGADTIYEAYAMAHKGDAIVAYCIPWGDGYDEAGHSRMLTADPIVIRDRDGNIDTTASYMVTTEQGGGGSYHSSWRVDYVYSFQALLDDSADSGSSGYYRTYIPVTMRALQDENIRPSYINNYTGDDAVTAPNKGKIYSNCRIISTTVTVKNGNTVVYENEVFTGVGPTSAESGSKCQTADLALHTEAFAAAAEAAGLVAGNTYTFTVEVLLSDASTFNSVTNKAFVYNP